jgi:hypothetical protein
VCEAEEVERLGLAPSVPLAVLSGVATKLDQAGAITGSCGLALS